MDIEDYVYPFLRRRQKVSLSFLSTEEEVFFPAAILVCEYLKSKSDKNNSK